LPLLRCRNNQATPFSRPLNKASIFSAYRLAIISMYPEVLVDLFFWFLELALGVDFTSIEILLSVRMPFTWSITSLGTRRSEWPTPYAMREMRRLFSVIHT
jgi:hypothetical protein